jgi:hypothetical protein
VDVTVAVKERMKKNDLKREYNNNTQQKVVQRNRTSDLLRLAQVLHPNGYFLYAKCSRLILIYGGFW